jgi:hypothetical protein
VFNVLHRGRLFAAITAGVVISAGVIAMSAGPDLSSSNSAGGTSFRIVNVMFAATGFNTSSCSLLNGIVILQIEGLSGDQKLANVTIGGHAIALENIYTHAGETTTVVLDYPWIQGYKYHLKVTSQSQTTAEADSRITPEITPSNVTLKSISLKGPAVTLTIENNNACSAFLTQVLVSGPNIGNEIDINFNPIAVQPLTSSNVTLRVNFSQQNRATYSFIVIVGGRALNATAMANPITGGGIPTSKTN